MDLTDQQGKSPTRHERNSAAPPLLLLCVRLCLGMSGLHPLAACISARLGWATKASSEVFSPSHSPLTTSHHRQAQHGRPKDGKEEGGHDPSPSYCAAHTFTTCWVEIPGVLYAVLDGLDTISLSRLSQASSTLHAAVERWASFAAKRDWAAVPYGLQVDEVDVGTPRSQAVFPPSQLPLRCLQFMREMGPKLIEQQRYSPVDGMEKAQCRARQQRAAGGTQEEVGNAISHERNCAVAWIWDRASFFVLDPAVTHAAISLLDRTLCYPMPASKVRLLAMCCMVVESHRGPPSSSSPLTHFEVEHLGTEKARGEVKSLC